MKTLILTLLTPIYLLSNNFTVTGNDTIFYDDYNSVPEELRCADNKILVHDVSESEDICISFSALPAHMNNGDSLPLFKPLPIELVYTNIVQVENSVRINFSTLSETNNDKFEIQVSRDAVNYRTVKHISGQGNSSEISNYSTTIEELQEGVTYLQLKQIDFDGQSETFFLGVVDVEPSEQWEVYTIFDLKGNVLAEGRYKDLQIPFGFCIIELRNKRKSKTIKSWR